MQISVYGRLCKEEWPEVVRVHVQLMTVIDNVMPTFITLEEVDGFLFHKMEVDRKMAAGDKERVSIPKVPNDCGIWHTHPNPGHALQCFT